MVCVCVWPLCREVIFRISRVGLSKVGEEGTWVVLYCRWIRVQGFSLHFVELLLCSKIGT